MGVLDGREHVEKETQSGGDAEPPSVAIAVDVLACDVLQHEIRLAGGGDARIEQTRDVRVGQAVRCPRAGTLLARPAEETQVQELYASLALEPAVFLRANQTLPIPP